MAWLADMKLRGKLTLAFAMVVGLMVFVGVFAIQRMTGLNQVADDMAGKWMPALGKIERIRATYHRNKMFEYAFIQSAAIDPETGKRDEEMFAMREREIVEVHEQATSALVEYEGMLHDDEERALFTVLRAGWDAYLVAQAPVLQMAREGKVAQAWKLSLGPLDRQYKELRLKATAVVDIDMRLSRERAEASSSQFRSGRAWIIGVLIGSSLLAAALAFGLARWVATSLARVVGVIGQAAEGDLTVRVGASGRDEIGQMATSMDAFLEKLHGTLCQVAQASAQVASAAQQLSASSDHLAGGAQAQAASIEETASSLEEMTSTVRQNAESARQANEVATGSQEAADEGGRVVGSAVAAMGEITRASHKIGEIIGVIDEIAFQTNLLALNAAVEAARAGEQGRGFAVVAAEVRSLAQRSATSAKEIKSLIGDTLQKVQDGSVLVNTSGKKLNEIVGSVKQVSTFVGEIATASHEQASGIDQVNRAVSQMDQVVQNNSAQTEELSATAEELSSQAEGLRALVAKFKLGAETASSVAAPVISSSASAPARGRPGVVRQRPTAARRPAAGRPSQAAWRPSSRPDAGRSEPSEPASFESF